MRRTASEPRAPAALQQPKLSFKLDELGVGPQLDAELGREWLAEVLAESVVPFAAEGPVHVTGQITALDGGALLRGELTANVSTDCSRCLARVEHPLVVPLTLRYVPRRVLEDRLALEGVDKPGAESAGSFDTRELDEEPFDGHRIDLLPALREQTLLGLPMKAVCREDCRGLCATCGQNRNEINCGCQVEDVDPRWKLLQRLKLDS